MDRHSVATTTNNGHNHLISSLQHAGRLYRYRQALYNNYDSRNSGQDTNNGNRNTIAIVVAVGLVVLLLLRCLYRFFHNDDMAEAQETTTTAGDGREPPQQQQQQHVRVEMAAAPPEVRPAGDQPPLVCTYRKEDGWREGTCGVCLADLADGEALRVLPACMHYFHDACVGEWLRIHANCPLCRAPLVAPVDGTA